MARVAFLFFKYLHRAYNMKVKKRSKRKTIKRSRTSSSLVYRLNKLKNRYEDIIKSLREKESNYKTILRSSHDIIFQLSPLGFFQYVSPKVRELYGYKEQDLIGKHIKVTTPMHDIPKALKTMKRALLGETIKNFELDQLDKKGRIIRVEINASPIKKGNKITGAMGVLRDITERSKAEEALRHKNETIRETLAKLKKIQNQLIESEKLGAIGRLASGVAHEVKNPLATILQGINYLQKKVQTHDKNIHLTLQRMDKAIERADGIIKGLLDFASISEMKKKPENINSIIKNSLLLLKNDLNKYGIEVFRDLGKNIPNIELDRNRIEQVFVNLFMNAIQAMPKGGKLKIKTHFKSDIHKKKNLIIEIEDTGIGIPKHIAYKMFEPFVTTKQYMGGAGLGLSIVSNIVKMHGGEIDIHSKKGSRGTKAIIIF